MKKSKSLGPSNDAVPEDELLLAALIQNANAWGLRPCRGAMYKRNGRNVSDRDDIGEIATHCCALGAYDLQPPEYAIPPGVVDGNDRISTFLAACLNEESYCSGVTVGDTFQRALR